MLNENNVMKYKAFAYAVLILVLMEYAQWGYKVLYTGYCRKVLILVLMEYAQWEVEYPVYHGEDGSVLILVLMEYAQWVNIKVFYLYKVHKS